MEGTILNRAMLRKMIAWCLTLVCALSMAPLSGWATETEAASEDPVVATVNGTDVLRSDVETLMTAMMQQLLSYYQQNMGQMLDPTDEEVQRYVASFTLDNYTAQLALTEKARSLALFTPEEEAAWLAEGVAQYQESLEQYKAYVQTMMPDATDEDLTAFVLEMLATEGYTEEIGVDEYVQRKVFESLYAYATRDITASEEAVRAAYAELVQTAKDTYEGDMNLFLDDYINGAEISYNPAGIRLVQHILLAPTTEEEFPVVVAQAEGILAELAEGMTFADAMAAYSLDTSSMMPPLDAGYPIFEGALGYPEEFLTAGMALAQVGDISGVVQTDASVHILRYAGDVPTGEVPFETVQEAFTEVLLETQKNEAYTAQQEAWLTEATITTDIEPLIVIVPLPEAAVPVTLFAKVSATQTALLDRPAGIPLALMDAGVTMTIEGQIGQDDEVFAYGAVYGTPWVGYVRLADVTLIAQDEAEGQPFPEGVHPQTLTEEEVAGKLPLFTLVMNDGSLLYGELYPETAPQSVGSFVALANAEFYNGLIFHRIIPGFMIQGGDPTGTGMGDAGYSIRGEFSANGVENPVLHERGVLSMARSNMPLDSASSQFFICVATYPSLDGQYAAFGRVLDGMEIADAIVNTPRDGNNLPLVPQQMKLVHVETYGVEYPFDKLDR